MTLLDHALTSCLAAALLAGCSGSQPPIGATAQGGTAQAMAHASSGSYSLLHVGGRFEAMYSYPRMKALGTLTPEAGFGQGCPYAVTGNIYFPANISAPIVLLQFPYGARHLPAQDFCRRTATTSRLVAQTHQAETLPLPSTRMAAALVATLLSIRLAQASRRPTAIRIYWVTDFALTTMRVTFSF